MYNTDLHLHSCLSPCADDNMTPQAWTNYADRVRSTHWFERFPEGDGRRLLTWKIFTVLASI